MRTSKVSGIYKGSAGSVRSISVPTSKPQEGKPFATVGLDRYLRIYDFDSRKLLYKLYLKQRLSSALILNATISHPVPVEDKAEKQDQDSESDINDEDIFEPIIESKSESKSDSEDEDDSDEDSSEQEDKKNNAKKRKSKPTKTKTVKKNKHK